MFIAPFVNTYVGLQNLNNISKVSPFLAIFCAIVQIICGLFIIVLGIKSWWEWRKW